MVTTITNDAPALTYMSFPIDKARTRVTADGDVEIYGKATDGIVDSDDQIVDPVWSAKAVKDWLETGGNVRVQHQAMRDPAGRGLEVTHDDMGGQWVKALIVEPVAKNLVLKGVLRSYSIGIMHPVIVPDQLARNGRIIGGEMGELSLVDRPANKNCKFELVKRARDGGTQWVGKMFGKPVATPSYLAAMAAAKQETDATALTKVGPHGYEHGWVHLGVPGASEVADKKPAASDASHHIMTAGHVADHVMTGQKKTKDLSDKDLKDADNEFSRRAALLGKPGQISGSHRKVKNEIARRTAAKKRKGANIDLAKQDLDLNIPHSWTKGSMADGNDTAQKGAGAPCSLCKGKGKIRKESMECPDCHGSGEASAEKVVENPLVLKAGSRCADCDHMNENGADSCTKCGMKMAADDDDTVDKGLFGEPLVPYVLKTDDSDSGPGDMGADSMDDDDSDDEDDDSNKSVAQPAATKGKMKCPNCSGFMKAKQKFCPGCGKKAPTDLGKSARTRPTPGDGVTGEHTDHVPAHREPDGKTVEAFEADAKLPTEPDAEYKTAMHYQTLNVPQDMATLHDLLCPVYHPAVTEKAYPGATVAGVLDVDDWQMKAMEAAAGATLEEAQAATRMWKEASTLAQTDGATLDELRHGAFKAFQDANIGPGAFPTPTTITPGMFKRPYLSGGHARPSFQQAGPNTASVPTGQISAAQFDRGYLTAGTATDSPANKSDRDGVDVPTATGKPQRMFYSNAQRDNAVQAMQVMHDHISHLFPDVCGMGSEMAAPTGATAVAVGKSEATAKATKKQKTAKSDHGAPTVDEAREGLADQVDMLTKAFTPDALKAAFAGATAQLTADLAEAVIRMKVQAKEIKRLNKAVDSMANQPDPRTAPFRGLAQPGALKSYGAQVASPSPAEVAARTQLALMAELENDFRTSHDPSAREAAWNQICKMRGLIN